MEMSDLPEPIRARLQEEVAPPALEAVREFLLSHVADAENFTEIRSTLRRSALVSTRSHHRGLAAIEALLTEPAPGGTLARLVAWDGNWVLDDPSDAGAAAFLRELANLLRSVLDEVE
jgi:hypothetical protein